MSTPASRDIYVGLMSGTSLDGVDVAVVDFTDFPPRLIHCESAGYDDSVRDYLRQMCQTPNTSLDTLYELDAQLADVYADAVEQALTNAAIDKSSIVAIGCHGQTIRHSPDSATPYSAQIGDPGRLAVISGITTVADFRRKDLALGGQGAPLAPAFHQFLFRSDSEHRAVINIGGIANITWLPADPDTAPLGFDTGPGNTLLDYWVREHYASDYDDGGSWARGGQVIQPMLNQMLTGEPYFVLSAPKSTGTEYFNPNWLIPFLKDDYAAQDVQATLVELTAITIAEAIRDLPVLPANCYLCGGGTHNLYLVERIVVELPDCGIQTTAALGLDPDYVEAVAFAWLARERLQRRPGNLPSVTRATRETVLGAVYLAD